jgi:hypothetical protein
MNALLMLAYSRGTGQQHTNRDRKEAGQEYFLNFAAFMSPLLLQWNSVFCQT